MRLRNIPRAEGVLSGCKKVINYQEGVKGGWAHIFGNSHPIHIEIGMGKGQFLLTLARQNPQNNYVGIERYSSVLLRAVEAYYGLEEKGEAPENIRFICMDAREIYKVFSTREVEKIYLNFSDPWPKARHTERRLTSREFFDRYDQILQADGTIEFKTDNQDLFTFSMEQIQGCDKWKVLENTRDLHNHDRMKIGNVMTEYEEKFSSQGNPICKLVAGRQSHSGSI